MKHPLPYSKPLFTILFLTSAILVYSCIGSPEQTTSSAQNQISVIQQKCLSPQALPKSLEARLDGILTLSTTDFFDPYYFFDLDTKNLYPFPYSPPDHMLWGGSISPNGQWIAFEIDRKDNNRNTIESNLMIFDAHGHQTETMTSERKWGALREWLDNGHLFIEGWGQNLGKIFVVNPFTHELREVDPFFSDLYNDYPPAYWYLVPNSELTLALYLNKQSKDENLGFNLWDINKKEKIWHQDTRTAPSIIPQWSPDQTQFAVVVEESLAVGNHAEIMIVDYTGRLILHTDFSSSYSFVFIGGEEDWSPDGRYLFFWLSAGNDNNPFQRPRLAVLNLKEKTVIDLCIKSYGTGNSLTFSQDGRWLVTFSDEANANILLDIPENKAYLFPIPIDGKIDGWMTKP